ncbi:putative beta-barrel porin 2 [Roseimicrobium gellanilyticum]|uniref:Putative beta-barrel porin 2 n=1 Tax=Roseimicrobium gellanilyticum TaxID=748857 RepID=A0A366HVT2_9BACT|nr:outer membrane beta-barrel protein [Roseimicrobium gellanilyticum]RBP47595.1 putative beta-barrel porin 2 [Roseimicrobium gellanilyticum]
MTALSRHLRIASALVLLGVAVPLSAQTQLDPARAAAATPTDAATQALIRAQEEATSAGLDSENAYAPASPGDSDLGDQLILKRLEKVQPFTAWLDSSVFWTDNAANVSNGEIDDWFYVGGVNISWQQRLKGRFYGDAYIGQHWYRYDELDALDYENGEASLGLIVLAPELANSVFFLNYYYQRITQGLDDSPIYDTHNIRFGAQKTFLIDRLNSVNLSLMSSFSVDAEPDVLRRHEQSLHVGYNFKITRELLLSLTYRLIYYDYFNLEDREDWYQNFGAYVTWRPKKYLELSAGYNFTLNKSNIDAFEYEAQLAGPSVVLKYQF